MKKSYSRKASVAQDDAAVNMAAFMDKLQQQIIGLERKIDVLIGHASKNSHEAKKSQYGFQRFDNSNRNGDARKDTGYRERMLYKTICADCNKSCEVPFKPVGDRPVYCQECYAARRNKNRSGDVVMAQAKVMAKPVTQEKSKAPAKKKKSTSRTHK